MSPQDVILLSIVIAAVIAFAIIFRLQQYDSDPAPYWVFGWPVLTMLLWTIPAVWVNFTSQRVCKTAEIVSVGGCDRTGNCGVMTSLNTKEIINHPVRGELVNTLCEVKWDE